MGWFTAQYEMLLFCVKTVMKESRNFELAHLKKKNMALWRLCGLVLSRRFFVPVSMLFVMKTLEDGWHIVIKFTVFAILSDFFCIIIYCVSALSLHIFESTNSIMQAHFID